MSVAATATATVTESWCDLTEGKLCLIYKKSSKQTLMFKKIAADGNSTLFYMTEVEQLRHVLPKMITAYDEALKGQWTELRLVLTLFNKIITYAFYCK